MKYTERKYTRRKAEWVRKLVKSKSFILVTDDDSIMNIRGTKDTGLLNLFDLAIQRSHLASYRDRLEEIIKEHDVLLGDSGKKAAKKPVRKIKVKKG